MKSFSMKIPDDLHNWLKKLCIDQDVSMRGYIIESIAVRLKENGFVTKEHIMPSPSPDTQSTARKGISEQDKS